MSTGSVLVTPTGIAADLTATFSLAGLTDIPVGFTPGTTPVIRLQLNTMPTRAVDSALGLDLPAGRYLRLQLGSTIDDAHRFSLTAFGQSVSGVFAVEQVTGAGADHVLGTTDDRTSLRIQASDVRLFLGDPGGTAGFRLTNGSALFLLTPDGIAGRVSATVSLEVPGITAASATVTLELNDMRRLVGTVLTPLAVDEAFVLDGVTSRLTLPAGPYVRATVTGLVLVIGGQRLTGDVSVERITTVGTNGIGGGDDVTTTKLRFANVGLRLGSPDRDVIVISNASGAFDIAPSGVVGTLTATVAVDIPGATVSGTFGMRLTTTGALSGGITPGITVSGTGVTVAIAGQRLTGGFTFSKNAVTGVLSLALTNVTLELGNGGTPFVTITLNGSITVASAG